MAQNNPADRPSTETNIKYTKDEFGLKSVEAAAVGNESIYFRCGHCGSTSYNWRLSDDNEHAVLDCANCRGVGSALVSDDRRRIIFSRRDSIRGPFGAIEQSGETE